MSKGTLILSTLIWLSGWLEGQDSCQIVPLKKINIINNPSFEIINYPCISGFYLPQNWYAPTDEIATGFLYSCSNFIIPDSLIYQESNIVPYMCLYPQVPQPIPDGNGVAAVSDFGYTGAFYLYPFHKSYVSGCLTSVLKKDTLYRLDFYAGFGKKGTEILPNGLGGYYPPQYSKSPETFEIFGLPDCSKINNSVPIIGCPSNDGWIQLGKVTVSGDTGTWKKASILFTPPQNIQAFALGPSCDTVFALNDTFDYKGQTLNSINYSYFLDNLQLLVASVPFPTVSISAGSSCDPSFTLQMQPASFYQGSSISWYRNDTLIAGEQNFSLTVNRESFSPGWYHCHVQNDTVCLASDSLFLDFYPMPIASILGTVDSGACTGDTVYLNAGIDTGFSYLWQDGTTGPVYRATQTGTYSVKISNACGSAMSTKSLEFKKCNTDLFVPNAFTPNGDGLNDIFKPLYSSPPHYFSMNIFNRLGQRVFFTTDPTHGWDGKGDESPEPAGTYVWMIDYTDHSGISHTKKGTVVLIR